MSALLKKPRQWVFSSAVIAPGWEWFYRDLIVAFPMWDGPGSTFYGVGSLDTATFNAGTPVWGSDQNGLRIDFSGASAVAKVDGTAAADNFSLSNQFSISVFASATSYVSAEAAIGVKASAGNGVILYPYDTSDGDGFRVHYSGTSVINENTGAIADGKNHLFTYTQFSATDHRAWIDGIEVATSATSRTLNDNVIDIAIGAWQTDGTQSFNGSISYVALHKRPISLTDHIQLSHDPFGPFRLVDEVGDVLIPSPVVVSTNSIIPILKRRRR